MKKNLRYGAVLRNRISAPLFLLIGSAFAVTSNAQIAVPVNQAPKASNNTWYYASNVTNASDPADAANPVFKVVTNYNLYGPGIVSPAIPITGAASGATLSVNFSAKSAMTYNGSSQIKIWYYVSNSQVSNTNINWLGVSSSKNSKDLIMPLKPGSWSSENVNFTVNLSAGQYLYIMITGDGSSGYNYYLDNVAITVSSGSTSLNVKYAPDHELSVASDNKQNSLVLNWATASEVNNKGFWVERSGDNGKTWSDLSFVNSKATTGNSSSVLDYSYTDASPLTGLNTYRLKQEDLDGKFEFSTTASQSFSGNGASISIYPNPVSSNTLYLKNVSANSSFRIINIAGRTITAASPVTGNGIQVGNLPSGIYFLEITSAAGKSETIKFIKK